MLEMSPDDFGAGNVNSARAAREEEDVWTVGGAGTRSREDARKHITKKLANLESVALDPEKDNSYISEFINLLEWTNAVYGDLPEFKYLETTMTRITKSHGHK